MKARVIARRAVIAYGLFWAAATFLRVTAKAGPL